MSKGKDKADLNDPFELPWPPNEGARIGALNRSDVDIDLTLPDPAATAAAQFGDTPQVRALVIAEHAGPHLADVLDSLADQSYDNLETTVLNATGDPELERRLSRRNPFADWVQMSRDAAFAELANWALEQVDEVEAPFLMIVRDDTALAPGAVSYLVEEMFRSNAGIVGPKLVDWNDPSKLLAVGYGADRRGRRVDLIESDEFDQDQYAAVADVFVIPSGVQLIRTDLFKHLGGFDPVMTGQNEDLDLCWRAHTVAARVVVVPQATARISRPVPSRALAVRQHGERSRNRLRTLAVTTGRWGFPRAILSAVVGLILSAIGNVLRVRPAYAKATLAAIPWNLRRVGNLRQRRRELRSIREVGDSEIHALQTHFGPSVGSLVEQSVRPTARLAEWTRSIRRSLVDERQRVGSSVAAFIGMALLMILLGTWDLIGDAPVVVGSNPILPADGGLIEQWWSGYRRTGLGSEVSSPLSFLVFGVASILFGWSEWLLHYILLVGPLALGAIGVFRMVRPLGGPRAAAVATAIAVANPVTADAYAAARWETLVVWALAPYLIVSICRLGELTPWSQRARPLPTRLVRFGVLTAVGFAFAPAFLAVAILGAITLVLVGFITGRLNRAACGAAGIVAAIVVPAALHLRFARDVIRGDGWSWMVGTRSPEEEVESFAELIEFAAGRSTGSILMWGLVSAASLGLVFGRAARFEAAVLGWTAAFVGFVAAWISTTGFSALPLPGADVSLCLAAAGLALAVGSSVRAVQIDLKRYGYGWRQFATIAAAAGGIAVLLLGFGKSLDGRHTHPEVGYAEITALLQPTTDETRILWLGDERIIAAHTSTSPMGVSFAITNGGTSSIADRYLPTAPAMNSEVGTLIDVAVSGDTVRLGRLLAPFGIDYIIFQPQLAPAPYQGQSFGIDTPMSFTLDDQLDLRRQVGTLNLLVFQNEASGGSVVLVGDEFDASLSSVVELLDTDLSTARAVLPTDRSGSAIQFAADASLSPGARILIAQPADNWAGTGGAGSIDMTVGGTALLTIDDPSQPFGMEFQPPQSRWFWLAAQALLMAGAFMASAQTIEQAEPKRKTEGATLDLRSDRQVALDLDEMDMQLEPVGDAL